MKLFGKRDEIFTVTPQGSRPHKERLKDFLHKFKKSQENIDDYDEVNHPSQTLEEFTRTDEEKEKERSPFQKKSFFSALTKNKAALGVLCMSFALLLGFLFVPFSSHMASLSTATVVRAKANIPKGALIDAAMLEMVPIGTQNLPKNVLYELQNAVGQYAAMDIVAQETILSEKLIASPTIGETYLSDLPQGHYAVSVSVKSFAAGISGKLLPGDVVSVYAGLEGADDKADYRTLLSSGLYYVRVLSVSNEEVGDTDKASELQQDTETASTLATAVTLECVSLHQVQELTGLEQNGSIHLSLAARSGEEYKSSLLASQERYFVLYDEFVERQRLEGLYQAQQQPENPYPIPGEDNHTLREEATPDA